MIALSVIKLFLLAIYEIGRYALPIIFRGSTVLSGAKVDYLNIMIIISDKRKPNERCFLRRSALLTMEWLKTAKSIRALDGPKFRT